MDPPKWCLNHFIPLAHSVNKIQYSIDWQTHRNLILGLQTSKLQLVKFYTCVSLTKDIHNGITHAALLAECNKLPRQKRCKKQTSALSGFTAPCPLHPISKCEEHWMLRRCYSNGTGNDTFHNILTRVCVAWLFGLIRICLNWSYSNPVYVKIYLVFSLLTVV